MSKEIPALMHYKCFDFEYPNFKLSREYQYVRLRLVYDVKLDLTTNAHLVCDGSQVEPRGLSNRATVVKGISVRLLDIIYDSQNLKVLTGDIGNTFIQAHKRKDLH